MKKEIKLLQDECSLHCDLKSVITLLEAEKLDLINSFSSIKIKLQAEHSAEAASFHNQISDLRSEIVRLSEFEHKDKEESKNKDEEIAVIREQLMEEVIVRDGLSQDLEEALNQLGELNEKYIKLQQLHEVLIEDFEVFKRRSSIREAQCLQEKNSSESVVNTKRITEINSSLQSTVSDLESKLSTLELEIEDMKNTEKELNGIIKTFKSHISKQNAELSDLRALSSTLENDLTKVTSSRDIALITAKDLSKEIQNLEINLEAEKCKTSKLESEILKERVAAIEVRECLTSYEKRVLEYEREVDELKKNIASLHTELVDLNKSLAQKELYDVGSKDKIYELEGKLLFCSNERDELRFENLSLQNDGSMSRNQILLLSEALTSKNEEIETLSNNNKDLKRRIYSLQKNETKLENELAKCKEELENCFHDIQQKAKSDPNLVDKVTRMEYERQLRSLEDALRSLTELEAEKRGIVKDLWKTKSERDKVKRRLEELMLNHQALDARLNQTSSARLRENDQLKKMLSDKDASVIALTTQVKSLTLQIEKLLPVQEMLIEADSAVEDSPALTMPKDKRSDEIVATLSLCQNENKKLLNDLEKCDRELFSLREKLEAASRRELRLELDLSNCKEELLSFKSDFEANYRATYVTFIIVYIIYLISLNVNFLPFHFRQLKVRSMGIIVLFQTIALLISSVNLVHSEIL